MTATALQGLVERIGAEHVERRLKVETEHEAQLFGQGLIFFNLENWYSAPWIVRNVLRMTGLYGRARRNADQIVIRRNLFALPGLPRHLIISPSCISAICTSTSVKARCAIWSAWSAACSTIFAS
jgi:hypothetical protein